MMQLVLMELFKISRQRQTYYAVGAVLVLEGFILMSAFYQGREILEVLLENLRESFEFQGDLMNGNLVIYLVLNSFWFHMPLILMIVVSGFLTVEYKDRTVEATLLQPVSRGGLIVSKYLAALVFTGAILVLLAGSTFGVSYAFFGRGDLVVFLDGLSFFEHPEAIRRLLYAFITGSNTMMFYAVTSLTLAVIFKEATVTWIVAAIFLIINTLLLRLDMDSVFYDYFFLPKLTDSWQYLFYSEIPWGVILKKNLVLWGYTLGTAALGAMIFVKRDVK
ncbi:ABC transporter permease [Robiginitalea marina]|uniref:ABC transporter permease n=1 Tax=Robiginitalea marina TaxID=2954105 RepID=A0ABT1AVI1_9FLAO|nr:ABC transporter permease [Robiginitalea marina]MCO5723607.1 ABC transporter permease [Robiginitalea marina]